MGTLIKKVEVHSQRVISRANRTSRPSGVSFQECIQFQLRLSAIFPILGKFLFQLFGISSQLFTLFATTCVDDLPKLLAHRLTHSLRRKSILQLGLQSIRACSDLNELEGDLEIAAQVNSGRWLVGDNGPVNPVEGVNNDQKELGTCGT